MHAYFLPQQDVRKKYSNHDKLEDTVLVKIDAIHDRTSNTKELVTLKKLKALQLDLSKKMDSLVLKSFTLYQQMFSPPLCGECDNIV